MSAQTVISRAGGGRASGVADADPITTEIVRQGLNAASDQMKRALVRTSFSPVIYEVLDFAAALYDRDICLLAQAPTLPVFMGTMSFCVRGAVDAVGGEQALEPGDIILYNDPFGTGSHPQDAAMVMPVFLPEGELDRLRRDQGALARHRRQGAVLDRHGRRVPGRHDLPRRQAVLARPAGLGHLPLRDRQLARAEDGRGRHQRRRSWACAPAPPDSCGWSSGTGSSASTRPSSACTTTARRWSRSGSRDCLTGATSAAARWTPTA